MKILHFGFQADMASGIGNQLAFEQSAAASLSRDIEWDTKFFTLKHNPLEFVTPVSRESSEGLFVWVSDYFKLRNCAFNWLKRNSQKYDVVLLRYSSADPVQYFHSRWFDNVFTIHHSFEIEESRLSGGGKGRLKSYIEKQLGRSVVGRVKGVIGVTDEIARYEKARVCGEKLSYCYPNGIDLSLATLADDDRSGIPKVLMVASSFVSWHGLDLLVDSFK